MDNADLKNIEDHLMLSEELASVFYQIVRLVFVLDNSLLQDLSITHTRLLRTISDEPGKKVADLAQVMGLSISRMSRMLTSMTNQGLIDRETDPSDKRIVRIYLKDIAKDAFIQREKQRIERMNACLTHMSHDNALRLIESLHLMKRAAEKSQQ